MRSTIYINQTNIFNIQFRKHYKRICEKKKKKHWKQNNIFSISFILIFSLKKIKNKKIRFLFIWIKKHVKYKTIHVKHTHISYCIFVILIISSLFFFPLLSVSIEPNVALTQTNCSANKVNFSQKSLNKKNITDADHEVIFWSQPINHMIQIIQSS